MTHRGRVLAVVFLTTTALTALMSLDMARSERSVNSVGQVVPQRVVLPQAAPAEAEAEAEQASAQPELSAPARSSQGAPPPAQARMAAADLRTRECENGAGAESRVGLMEYQSVHGHCDSP